MPRLSRVNAQTKESTSVIPSKYLQELESWPTPAEAGRIIGITKQGMIKRLEEGRQRGVRTRQGWLVDPEALTPLEDRHP
jgi:hypothetical protein